MMITCPLAAIDGTLALLRQAGQLDKECVVLWLGTRRGSEIAVADWYLPIQEAEVDYFRIPPEGMAALQAKLRSDRLMVAAQIHSHPGRAFHSEADDEWAIVRHLGALSLVVPRFASDTFANNFLEQAKVYQFSSVATWDEIPSTLVTETCLQII